MTDYVATAETDIDAPRQTVWDALTDPAQIKQFMFGAQVSTDWQPGSPITWKGEYEGKPYEDKGEIVEVQRGSRLVMTHFSPLSGQEDKPENYHRLTYELADRAGGTHLSLSQDGNGSEDEADHSRKSWEMMLGSIKELLERE
jgi:uncharacterized protein YndB with AHSA1/START domain